MASAHAQGDADGGIAGRVMSASGVAVEGATVVVQEIDTGLAMEARSGPGGDFLLPRLPVGEYRLQVRLAGWWLELNDAVEVHAAEVAELEARLPGAALPSRIVERGEDEVDAGTLALLPVDGGQWRSLALTLPGANDAAGADDNAAEVSFRGVAVTQNSSSVDGANADQSFASGPSGVGVEEDDRGSDEPGDRSAGPGSQHGDTGDGGRRAGSAYTFAQAAVREFRVQGQQDAAGYGSAVYGHGVGGVVTAATRQGGTALHGMVFYTVRDSAWAAANPYSVATSYVDGAVTSAVVKPRDLRQQFGGRVGGPVGFGRGLLGDRSADARREGHAIRDQPKLFYFYAFDQQRRDFPAVSSPGYAGFYSLTPTQTALLANRGVTAAKTMAALNYLDSLTGNVARQANQTVNFARLDWQPGGAVGRVSAEYNRARWGEPAGARSGAVVDRGRASLGSSYGKIDAGVARWVALPRSGLSNELRIQYGRQLQWEAAQTPLPQEPAVGPDGLPPEVSIGPQGLVFGTPAGLGQRAYPLERRVEVADVVGRVRGRQIVQIGADFAGVHDYTDSLANAEGTFSYDSGATGGKAGGLVDWITDYTFNVHAYPNGGCPSIVAAVHDFCFRSYSQSFGPQAVSFDTQEWAVFAQDDWRAARRLTVHAGLRYEYERLPQPQVPNLALDAVFGAVGATSVYPEDGNNLGPRLGAAWEPLGAGRGMVRAGWGAYFGRLPGSTIRAALLETAMPTSTTSIRILPTTETACPQMATVGFGYACSFVASPSGVVAATTSAVVFDRRFRLPEVQQGTLTVEHALGWGVLGSAGYVVNLDRQLPNSVDINIAPSTAVRAFQLQGGTGAVGVRDGETFVVPAYTARVSSSYGPVTDVISNANASYNGLTIEARRSAGAGGGRGLEFRAGWTWSKAIDFGQNAGGVPRVNGQTDPFTVRYDKGLSALNFPHRIVGSVVWTPRLQGEARALAALAKGWTLAAIFSEASGRPYSYLISGGTRLAGGRESINGSGGSVVLPTVGRNTLRLPGTANLDLRVSRSVRLRSEGLRLLGTAEVFNAANHRNASGVVQRAFLAGTPVAGVTPLVFQDAAAIAAEGLNVQPFGTLTAAGTSQARERQVQLGLRVEF